MLCRMVFESPFSPAELGTADGWVSVCLKRFCLYLCVEIRTQGSDEKKSVLV